MDVTVGTINHAVKKYIGSSLTQTELGKEIGVSFRVFVETNSKVKKVHHKMINIPFLSNTSLTYIIQSHFHLDPIDEHIVLG